MLIPVNVSGSEPSTPVVESVIIATSSNGDGISELNLIENSTTTVYIHGVASDEDGCGDIDAALSPSIWRVALFRTNVGPGCTPDGRNCYQVTEETSNLSGCTPGGSDKDLNYEMSVPVWYYADATDVGSAPDRSAVEWTADVLITDDTGNSGSNSATMEINTLRAFEVVGTADYGSVSVGNVSEEQAITVTNTGNDNDFDISVHDSGGWTCTLGTLGPEWVHWNLTALQNYESGTAVSSTATSIENFNLSKASDAGSSTKDVFVTLGMPTSGVAGNCTSTLTVLAI